MRASPQHLQSAPLPVQERRQHCFVFVEGLRVSADIGIKRQEIGRPQPLDIDITLRIDTPACDEIDGTFDYRRIQQAAEMLARQRISLIETFARQLAEICLSDPRTIEADVTIRKPKALKGCMAGTRLLLSREPD